MPTAVPIQCVEATTPKVPSISGRVVKGPALMLAIGCSGWLFGGGFCAICTLREQDRFNGIACCEMQRGVEAIALA